MDNINDIQAIISRLSPKEFVQFRDWFDDYRAKKWDEEFEHDAANGRLDEVADKALRDFKKGKCSEL